MILFYLEHCPYCKRAKKYIEELKQEEKYKHIEIQWVEESKEEAFAASYDYYYVPCFYINGKKVSEGAIDQEGVKKVFDTYLEVKQ